jgi:hypothetical protein
MYDCSLTLLLAEMADQHALPRRTRRSSCAGSMFCLTWDRLSAAIPGLFTG